MGEMKPTPGPWTVLSEEDDKDYLRIRGTRLGGRYKIANVHMPRYWESHDVLRDWENAESQANARLIAEAGTVFNNTGLSPVQLVEMVKELKEALTGAQQAINSMKVEAETAAQGDEQMMLEVCETISNEGLDADMAIRAALAKCEGVGND